jgi:dTDP-4-amino-4,6-dideoxygalactose transaminase
MQHLLDRGVASRRGIMCAHREKPYLASKPGSTLTESEAAQDRNVILPLYAQMSDDDQDYVCQVFREACAASR